jgi:hypothetical protein
MKSITEKINEELKKIKELPPLPEIQDFESDSILLSDDKDIVPLWDNMSDSTYKLDDYIIQPLDLSNIAPLLNTISISGTGAGGTLGIGGASGYQSIYNTAGPTYSWNTLNNPGNSNKVHITGAGIEMDEDADITIGGRSMKKMLEGIEHRLSILVPDPKKLQRYEALQQAYEHYKTLEALCNEEQQQEDK